MLEGDWKPLVLFFSDERRFSCEGAGEREDLPFFFPSSRCEKSVSLPSEVFERDWKPVHSSLFLVDVKGSLKQAFLPCCAVYSLYFLQVLDGPWQRRFPVSAAQRAKAFKLVVDELSNQSG